MKFLFDAELRAAVQNLQRKRQWYCAVAFWGRGAEELTRGIGHDNVKIICNLKSGGTNPYVIEVLQHQNVRQNDLLHAKVYLGDNAAIVCSANASANGLGFEGREQYVRRIELKTEGVVTTNPGLQAQFVPASRRGGRSDRKSEPHPNAKPEFRTPLCCSILSRVNSSGWGSFRMENCSEAQESSSMTRVTAILKITSGLKFHQRAG